MGCLGCPWLDTPWVLIFQEQLTQTTKSGDTAIHFTCKIVTIIQCVDWQKDWLKIFWTPLGFEADAATEPNCPSNEPKDESVKPLVGISFNNEKLLVGTFSHYCVLRNFLTPLLPSLTTPSPSHLSHTKQCANKTCLTLSFHSAVNCRIFNSKSNSYHTKLHTQVENMNTHNHT